MAQMPLVLVISPTQKNALMALCAQLEIAAVLNPTGETLLDVPVPVFRSMADLCRQFKPAVCCFLTPYADFKRDFFDCLENQIHVLSAGPLILSKREMDLAIKALLGNAIHINIGNRYLFSPLYQALLKRSKVPDFGIPIYLRQVTGGGNNLLQAWWMACEALDQAKGLLGGELRDLHIAARRKGQKVYLTLTVSMANRASAHLVIAPVHLPISSDLILLGSGGMLSADSISNSSAIIKSDRVRIYSNPELYPDSAWLKESLGRISKSEFKSMDSLEFILHQAVLSSIRQAIKSQAPVRVNLLG